MLSKQVDPSTAPLDLGGTNETFKKSCRIGSVFHDTTRRARNKQWHSSRCVVGIRHASTRGKAPVACPYGCGNRRARLSIHACTPYDAPTTHKTLTLPLDVDTLQSGHFFRVCTWEATIEVLRIICPHIIISPQPYADRGLMHA